jgi:nicotinamidase-related amidase
MLRTEDAVLVVVDVQERLLPFIHDSEFVVGQIVRLIRGFQIVGAPILVTEQYRKGLGPTAPEIIGVLEPARAFQPIEKMTFSCGAHGEFMARLAETGRRQVVLCGIESHVCVLQTALHLAEGGAAGAPGEWEVYLAADAVSSRSPRNLEIALRRMEQAGVRLTSCEMAVFEMLQVCGTPQFKEWSRIIR